MSNTTKVAAAIFAGLVLVGAAVYFIWLRPERAAEVMEPPMLGTPAPAPTPTPSLSERLSLRLQGVTLRTSDAAVRELASHLSANPKLAAWLANDDLIRRFVAAVNNVAAGDSPSKQVEFLRPDRPLDVVNEGGKLYIDPASYHRYDRVADVIASLNTQGTVALYHELQPLMDEAYREIAPPGREFSDRLRSAMDELLAVPVPPARIQVKERTVSTYAYADERFESMNAAQRHFLRMGPDNVRKVQAKLRELRDALSTPPTPTGA